MSDTQQSQPDERPIPALGTRASFTRSFTDADIQAFAQLSGDTNPVHLDADYARQTRFGQRIAHGMLTATMLSTLIGTRLPGVGAIYMSQTMRFEAPVFIGDEITASVEVIAVRAEKRLLTLRTECARQDGTVVLRGEAIVKC